jgi:hypothetical protein
MPEEEAFAVLVKLMQEYKMRDMFKPTMAELGLCMYQLENLVQVPEGHHYHCLKLLQCENVKKNYQLIESSYITLKAITAHQT